MPINSQCLGCGNTKATKQCSACKIAIYCSEKCQIEDWEAHKFACTYKPKVKLTSVIIVDGTRVEEKQIELDEDMSTQNGWTECEIAGLMGVYLKYKSVPSSHAKISTSIKKKRKLKELAQVFMVEPDRSLLNGPLDIISDSRGNVLRLLVSDVYSGKKTDFVWSDKAWKINEAKVLGPLVFAREDRLDFKKNLFWDLFNYIYDIMEYYRNGETFVVGIRKVKEIATPREFINHTKNLTKQMRGQCIQMNIEKFPDCNSNNENWFESSDLFNKFKVFNL